MAAILFWQILTLKLIFQLGKQFFQIQHIQFMKTQLSNYFYHKMPAGIFFITKYYFYVKLMFSISKYVSLVDIVRK